MARTMLEAHVHTDTSVTLHTAPIPTIVEPNDVIIRVICASCNPKDWKMPAGLLKTIANCPNSGDDIAGIVETVGDSVTTSKPGDRVAALHQLGAPFGAYAEYSLVKDFACFHLPDNMGWEQAATVPMALYMACIALYGSLKMCSGPWEILETPIPLLVFGAATAVGSMAVRLAQISNIHPVICVAGSGCEYVRELIDPNKGDVVLNYRDGEDAVLKGVRSALRGAELEYAFDAVSESHTIRVSRSCSSHGAAESH
jgi:NADPH:quinone reductase